MTFANPLYFILLGLLVPYIVWYVLRWRRSHPVLQVSSTYAFQGVRRSWKEYLIHAPFLLRLACIVLAVIALARPQTTNNWKQTDVEGIDIMLCMDVSTSMLAEDLRPNRVKAAREVAIEFISGRPNDNIGLTLFAGEAFTQCPMTVDHAVLVNMLQGMQCDMTAKGMIEDGTAIGMGLASAVARLKDSKAKSKVIILLTDGSNNRHIAPDCSRDSQEFWHPRLHHRRGYQRTGPLSDAGGRWRAVHPGAGGDRHQDAAGHCPEDRWRVLSGQGHEEPARGVPRD